MKQVYAVTFMWDPVDRANPIDLAVRSTLVGFRYGSLRTIADDLLLECIVPPAGMVPVQEFFWMGCNSEAGDQCEDDESPYRVYLDALH